MTPNRFPAAHFAQSICGSNPNAIHGPSQTRQGCATAIISCLGVARALAAALRGLSGGFGVNVTPRNAADFSYESECMQVVGLALAAFSVGPFIVLIGLRRNRYANSG